MKNLSTYPKSNNRKYTCLFVMLIVLTVLLLATNLSLGSVKIYSEDLLEILFKQTKIQSTDYGIIWKIRFPRALAALILGGALALSGYLLQTFFHKPIAGPFVLGISSGAKLMVALSMVYFLGKGIALKSVFMVAAAFVGAMFSIGFVLLVSQKLKSASMLIVSGIMVGYICSAITDLVVTFANDADIVNLHNWSRGSFSGICWRDVQVMALITLITSLLVFLMSKQINVFMLGDAYALSMGLNVKRFRVAIVILSGILSATVTAFAGPVSFVGIAVPQLAKRIFHTSKPWILIPACFLGGSFWCLLCDLMARTQFSPTELSISTVTAIFGVPVVLYVIMEKRRGEAV